MRRIALVTILILSVVAMTFATGTPETVTPGGGGFEQRLKLATTTSTDNSGLLDYILPRFTELYGFEVDVIAVGTGAALALGEEGDADVLLVHARQLEDALVAAGDGVNRRDAMYNDFVILGPVDDPAGVGRAGSAAEAFEMISNAGEAFISRGDNSGTHVKERAIWSAAGVGPAGDWYQEVGQGMGAVISIANEQQAYTIADRGTYLAYLSDIDIDVVFDGDPIMFNPYGIIAVNPAKYPDINYTGAMALITFITSPEGQNLIDSFTVNGEQLFIADTR